jgi:hypothetical protein
MPTVDPAQRQQWLEEAALGGWRAAMQELASTEMEWLGRCVRFDKLTSQFVQQLRSPRSAPYALGKALYFDVYQCTSWDYWMDPELEERAQFCMQTYCAAVDYTQQQVVVFLLCAKHTFPKDIRLLIAFSIWNLRSKLDFVCQSAE